MDGKRIVMYVLASGVLTVLSTPAIAHHGNAAYDDKVTEFNQATVTKVSWANPHALIDFDAKDSKGSRSMWWLKQPPLRRSD